MEKIMVKQLIKTTVSFIFVLSIIGCDKINELKSPGAEDALSGYLDASLKGKSKEAYAYVSAEDKEAKSLSEYKLELDDVPRPYAKGIESFKVLKVTELDDTATGNAEITRMDIAGLEHAVAMTFMGKFMGGIPDAGESSIANTLASGQTPTITETEAFHLVKEKDGWKVFLDWKGKKIATDAKDAKDAELAENMRITSEENILAQCNKYITNKVLPNADILFDKYTMGFSELSNNQYTLNAKLINYTKKYGRYDGVSYYTCSITHLGDDNWLVTKLDL